MSAWPTLPLASVCREITVGYVSKMSDQYIRSGIPFLRSQDILPGHIRTSDLKFISKAFHERLRKSQLSPGDVVIVRTGYPGTAAVIPKILPVANCADLVIARTGPQLNPRFLAFTLNSPWGQAQVHGRLVGVAQQHFNVRVAQALNIPLPPRNVQDRIVSILRAYDDLIAVNRQRIALLEEMARRLFEERVTRVVGGLPLPNSGAQQTQLPDGWSIEPLASVAKLTMGQSPPSAELNAEGIGLVFHQGVTDFGDLFPGRRVFCDRVANKRISEEGDILFSVRAPVGRINCALERTVLGRGVAGIHPCADERAYLLAHFRATFYDTDLIGNGAIYRSVTKADMEGLPIVRAPAVIRSKLNAQLENILALVRTLYGTNSFLASSRELLVPRLISGELSVSTAESDLEAAE